MTTIRLRQLSVILTISLLILTLPSNQFSGLPSQPSAHVLPGCTTFYGYDGQTALGGNNEDFNNPLTYVWFIPASPGQFGRVYFGYEDFGVQGGVNDQGVFFDGDALAYKAMPITSQRPHFPGGDLALSDEILSHSAKIQDVIDISSRWYRIAGENAQLLYGDRFGDSVIIDGDTILRKQGAFQLATNFRLVDNPNPPYPEERYGTVQTMLANADHYSVELFRQALDVAHAEGDFPTLYSQVYELKTGIIHLYQYHDFRQEVVINVADELAKGPHFTRISTLFPRNNDLEEWTLKQVEQWKAGYEGRVNTSIKPDSQSWMSGQYSLQGGAEAGTAKVYLEKNQLYLQKPNQLPIELYPTTSDSVFHHFFNGLDLSLTFQRNQQGEAIGAQGSLSFKPYNIEAPYNLTRPEVTSYDAGPLIILAGVGLVLIVLGFILFAFRRRKKTADAHDVN